MNIYGRPGSAGILPAWRLEKGVSKQEQAGMPALPGVPVRVNYF